MRTVGQQWVLGIWGVWSWCLDVWCECRNVGWGGVAWWHHSAALEHSKVCTLCDFGHLPFTIFNLSEFYHVLQERREIDESEVQRYKLCGYRLTEAIMLVCYSQARGKRHAIPEPSYNDNLSPFLTSIYRPSIEDDRDQGWDQWQLGNPHAGRFHKVGTIRVIYKLLIYILV
jgi:hypothetical protein